MCSQTDSRAWCDQEMPAAPLGSSIYSPKPLHSSTSTGAPHVVGRSRLCASSRPQAVDGLPASTPSFQHGLISPPQAAKPLTHAAQHVVRAAAHLLLWRAWAAAAGAPEGEQGWTGLRRSIRALAEATPGLLAAAWRSWVALQQGPVKTEGLALLLAQPGGLPALAHNPRLLLATAQQVASLRASSTTAPLTTWLAASSSFQQLLAQQPALMDAYLLELGRWSQRRAAHQCAAWKVLAALPRCLLVPLAQQRLHSSDRRLVMGAGVALTQL